MMLDSILRKNRSIFKPIVPFAPQTDIATKLNLSDSNPTLTPEIFSDTATFQLFISGLLEEKNARYGYGGYLENRSVYSRSVVFNGASQQDEPRSLHLGLDIWGKAGTPVMAPLDGIVHSTGNHLEYGNYGATIILEHELEHNRFYTLYGHLSAQDLNIRPGIYLKAGTIFSHFGNPEENGQWPPHLHFQIIADLQGHIGDYPGVCAPSKMDYFKQNCPDPALMVNFI